MKSDQRNLILKNQHNSVIKDIVNLVATHPYYGKGHVSNYSTKAQRVAIKFPDRSTKVIEDLDDFIGPDSVWQVTNSDLEQKFGHLRPTTAQKAQWPCTTPPQAKPSVAKAIRKKAKNRIKQANKKAGQRPPGAKPLFKLSNV